MNNLPIYNIVMGDEETGVFAVSLVDTPAVDSLFVSLEKEEQIMLFKADEELHIVYGCMLRADYPIYRDNDVYGLHYIMFSKEVIKQIAEKFMKEQNGLNVDLDHDFNYIDGVYLTQIFIKDSANGISPKGFEDVADGSLFGQYKIEDDTIWQDVKLGKFRGFSIEGRFGQELLMNKLKKEQSFDEFIDDLLK